MIELLPQYLVNGVMVGGVYALIAMGIVLIFKATGIFNFAVGELMLVGAFGCWTMIQIGLSPWLAIVVAVVLSGFLGLLIQRLALEPLIGQPILSAIMATLAFVFILRGLSLVLWKGMTRSYPHFLPGSTVKLGMISMSHELLWIFAISIAVFGVVALIFQRTKIGLGMRATAEDHQLAQARGVPVRWAFITAWVLSAAIAAITGILLGIRLGISLPLADMGLKAFPAVLLGGLDSIPGAIIGGLLIGLTESLTGGLIDPTLGQISPFIILIIVLIFRTEGLFGLKRIERI